MATPIKASELRYGLEASAGFQGNRLAPYKLVNVEINNEGRSVLRKGYISSSQRFEGTRGQLVVAHFVGDRHYDGVSRYKRIDTQATYALFGRRLFIADPSQSSRNGWFDADSNTEYDWELPQPESAPNLSLVISRQGVTGIVAVQLDPTRFNEDGGSVRIACATNSRVRVQIFNSAGILVRTLLPNENPEAVEGHEGFYTLPTGNSEFVWDGNNDVGEQVAQAGYFPSVSYLDSDDEAQVFDVQEVTLIDDLDEEEEFVEDIIDGGDLIEGQGFRRGIYAICYTYASSKHGIESPPSPISQIRVVASTNLNLPTRTDATINITGYSEDIPTWCDQIRFYAKRLGSRTNVKEPKDIPFDFTYINAAKRLSLSFTIPSTFSWTDERPADPFDYLRTKEFHTEPDQRGLRHILAYAGRIWGYDADLHVIRFSYIDRPEVMPYDDHRLPHAIRILGSWNARVQAMHVIPPSGGIYVFFPHAIRTIKGQQIITGIFQLEISPETDIDASGGINGKGTRSPHSIVSFGSMTFYLDTDRRVYSLGGDHALQTEEMSLSIQPFLDEATDDEIRAARAEIWQSRYHLMLGDRTYILDLQRNYWTIWDVAITSILHSVGGDGDEDILYALVDNQVVELYNGEASDETEWLWVTNYVELPRYSRVSEVVLAHPEDSPQTVEMRVETERGMSDWKEYSVSAGNKFRLGTFVQADVRVRVHIKGTEEIPRFNDLYIGVN